MENVGVCAECGDPIDDGVIEEVLIRLNKAVCDFLDFGTPSDLLEEIAGHLREHFETPDEEDSLSTKDLTRN